MINYKLDSNDESLFLNWLEALVVLGVVDYIEPERLTFDLNDEFRFDYSYKEMVKGKVKIKDSNNKLIGRRSYTPDFVFRVSDKCLNFAAKVGKNIYESKPLTSIVISASGYVYVDVKGSYTRNYTSSATFGDRQSILWTRYGIYVNKVVCHRKSNCLFKESFCPKEFIQDSVYKVGPKKGQSKINYPIVTEDDFKSKLTWKT